MHTVQGQLQTVLISVWEGRPQIVPTRLWQLSTPDGPWTLWVSVHSVHYILYIGRRTSYIGRRTSYNVALSPELSEFQCWNGQPQTILTRLRQCQSMTLHSPLNFPSLRTHCTSYIVRHTSPVVHRTSYIVHRTLYIVACCLSWMGQP